MPKDAPGPSEDDDPEIIRIREKQRAKLEQDMERCERHQRSIAESEKRERALREELRKKNELLRGRKAAEKAFN